MSESGDDNLKEREQVKFAKAESKKDKRPKAKRNKNKAAQRAKENANESGQEETQAEPEETAAGCDKVRTWWPSAFSGLALCILATGSKCRRRCRSLLLID